MEFTYQMIRSDRKTISLQITPEGKLLVRAPKHMQKAYIEAFLESKSRWIEKHMALQTTVKPEEYLTAEQIEALTQKARQVIPERVEYFAQLMAVEYGRITIRHQRTCWGSCSGKGNLNFNCLLMLTPLEVVDYVIVHELSHRKHMNHSVAFWAQVEKVLPDYRACKKWLKDNGQALIRRMNLH